MVNLKTSDKIKIHGTTFDTTQDNNCVEIDIMDNIAIDTLEYDSYKEAAVAVEMYSLQNVRVEKCDGKYKLIQCSEAMDISGRHLKVGDKVHNGTFRTWRITGIEGGDPMYIYLKSGKCKEYVYAFRKDDGQCVFNLKLGKNNAKYTVSCILASISEALGKIMVVMCIILFCVICAIALKVMSQYL